MEFNWVEYLFEPYKTYSSLQIVLELIASITGVTSVLFAIRKNIFVYPIGIISTGLYTYLLYQWGLIGEMVINAYYTMMSIYGWIQWNSNTSKNAESTISFTNNKEKRNIVVFTIISFIIVMIVYSNKFKGIENIPLINYFDATATAIFLSAMYLMAKMKLENWYFWLLGNLISIPLFIMKGYAITSIQYFLFLILSIRGIIEWWKSTQVKS